MIESPETEEMRRRMVVEQLRRRGIVGAAVLEAMLDVPRHEFVPEQFAARAYGDWPLPIGAGQTISQPFVVALMTEALDLSPGDRVLEIGTGSGYAAAVLARLGCEVFTIERMAELAADARDRLDRLGVGGVHVRAGDGSVGWPEEAPFDGIVVAAGSPRVPSALAEQLVVGGHMVIPVGATQMHQELMRITRTAHGYRSEALGAVRFVPLVGVEGWSGDRGGSVGDPS